MGTRENPLFSVSLRPKRDLQAGLTSMEEDNVLNAAELAKRNFSQASNCSGLSIVTRVLMPASELEIVHSWLRRLSNPKA